MANCVNKSLPEFKKLQEETGINPLILAAKVGVWQNNNTLDAFPTINEVYGFDTVKTLNVKNLTLELEYSEKSSKSIADIADITGVSYTIKVNGVSGGILAFAIDDKSTEIFDISIPEEFRGKGHAINIYRAANKLMMDKVGKPLSMSADTIEQTKNIWKRLVESGEAIKTDDGYVFNEVAITPESQDVIYYQKEKPTQQLVDQLVAEKVIEPYPIIDKTGKARYAVVDTVDGVRDVRTKLKNEARLKQLGVEVRGTVNKQATFPQLEGEDTRPRDVKLEEKLGVWARKYGIKIGALDKLREKLEASDELDKYPSKAVGLADIFNKLILISEGKANITTLPEEIGHFAIELLADDASVLRAMEIVDQTEIYNQVKEQYADIYTTEEQFKKEALGKIFGDQLIAEKDIEAPSKTKAMLSRYITAIKNKLTRFFNKIFKSNTSAKSEIQEIQELLKPKAQEVLAGRKIGNEALLERVEKDILSSNDKIIFGHPGIGKTFLRQTRDDVIDFDTDYKSKINKEFGLEEGWEARHKWRKNNKNLWDKKIKELWQEAVKEARAADKILVASDMILLREFATDFDKVVNITNETFINRSKQRGDYKSGETESWKRNLNRTIAKIDKAKVITTDKYFSDLFVPEGEGVFFQKEFTIDGEKILHEGLDHAGAKNAILKPLLKIAKKIFYRDKEHTYTDTETGKVLQSVNRHLSDIIPNYGISEKDQMKPNVRNAADQGTKVHNTFSSFFNNIDFKVDGETVKVIKPELEKLFNTLIKDGGTVLSEVIVANNELAGSIDIVVVDGNGKVILYDIKTSRLRADGKDYYDTPYDKDSLSKRESHTLQLSTYAEMFEENTGVKVDEIVVLSLGIKYEGKGAIEEIASVKEIPLTRVPVLTGEKTEAKKEPKKEEKKKPISTSKEETKIRFLNKSITLLKDRLEVLKTRATSESTEILRSQIDKIQRQLDDEQLDASITTLIDLAKKELKVTRNFIDKKLKEGLKVSNITLAHAQSFVKSYSALFDSIRKEYGFKETDPIILDIKEFRRDISDLEDDIAGLNDDATIEFMDAANRDAHGNILDPTYNAKEEFEKVGEDVSWWRVWTGSLKNSRSKTLRVIQKKIGDAITEVKRFTLGTGRELIKLQKAAEETGFKVEDSFEVDKDGNRTGNLVSKYNRGGYNDARYATMEELKEALGYEDYYSIVKENLSDEHRAIYTKHWKDFHSKHSKKVQKEVRLSETEIGYVTELVPADIYLNNNFAKLQANPAVKAYLDQVLKIKTEALNKLPSHYRTESMLYLMPQIRKTVLERLNTKEGSFLKNMKETIAEEFVRKEDDTEYGQTTDLSSKLIPIFFNRRLENINDLSTDVTSMLVKYAEMAENYKTMNVMAADAELLKFTMGRRQYETRKGKIVEGTTTKEYKAVDNLIDFLIYGRDKEEVIWKIPGTGKEINASKLAQMGAKYLRANNLALNMVTSTAGYFKGSIDSIIEDSIGQYTTTESKNWARKEYGANIFEVLSHVGKQKQTNKMHLIFQHNETIDSDRMFKDLHKGRVKRALLNHNIWYTNFMLADYAVKGRVALTVYDNYRLVDGKFVNRQEFIESKVSKELDKDERKKATADAKAEWKKYREKSLYNAYESVDGELIIKDEYKEFVTTDLENTVKNQINHVTNIVDGTISEEDKGMLSRQVMGSFILMHKGWLMSGIDNRLKHKGYNYETKDEEMGYYRAFWSFMKSFRAEAGGLQQRFAVYEKLTPVEQRGVKKTLLDLSAAMVVAVLAGMLQGMASDDEDDNLTLQYAAYQANRIFMETNAFFDPGEFINLVEEPVVGARILKDIWNLTDAFDPSEIEKGPYKGWTTAGKYWMKRTHFKNLYEIMYPEDKNRFVKSILGKSKFMPTGGIYAITEAVTSTKDDNK